MLRKNHGTDLCNQLNMPNSTKYTKEYYQKYRNRIKAASLRYYHRTKQIKTKPSEQQEQPEES